MTDVCTAEAKAGFLSLLDAVGKGQSVSITRQAKQDFGLVHGCDRHRLWIAAIGSDQHPWLWLWTHQLRDPIGVEHEHDQRSPGWAKCTRGAAGLRLRSCATASPVTSLRKNQADPGKTSCECGKPGQGLKPFSSRDDTSSIRLRLSSGAPRGFQGLKLAGRSSPAGRAVSITRSQPVGHTGSSKCTARQ